MNSLNSLFKRQFLRITLLSALILLLIFLFHIHTIEKSRMESFVQMISSQLETDRDHFFNLILLEQDKILENLFNAYKENYHLDDIQLIHKKCDNCKNISKNLKMFQKNNLVELYYSLESNYGGLNYIRLILNKEFIIQRTQLVSFYSVIYGVGLLMFFIFIYKMNLQIRKDLIDPIHKFLNSFDIQKIFSLNKEETYKFRKKTIYQLEEQEEIENKFFYLLNRLRGYQDHIQKIKIEASISQTAAQVAHDIRSPLAALRVCATEASQLPEEQRLLIRSAVQRIEDIANDLLSKKAEDTSKESSAVHDDQNLELHLLSSLMEPLISEKRLQHRSKLGVEIQSDLDEDSYGLFAKVNVKEFKRTLSNLINNAVEAFQNEGLITMSLEPLDEWIQIQVSDNGKGIPPEILGKLAQRGNTFSKEGGSGLGLYHARTTVEKWGGKFKVESEIGHGTTVTLLLPKEPEPSWFVPKIRFEENITLVIVDDDQSIHQIWNEKFSQYVKSKKMDIIHFSNPDSLREWHNKSQDQKLNLLFLCDYEFLGSEQTGLSIINELKISKHSILVTSRYEEKEIRNDCAKLNIKLIPKPLAGFVPIKLTEENNGHWDYILIDDDRSVRKAWEISARNRNKKLKTYKYPDDFLNECHHLEKTTPIYIDSNLSHNLKGEEVSKQIKELGFENIYLATGLKPKDFQPLPWITKIVGKAPPWSEF